MATARQLSRCVFCGSTDMSEEHLIADWVHRAFARKRKPDNDFAGTFVGRDALRVEPVASTLTARVVCRDCNNGWLSGIDNAAAQVLRPLVRGERDVELGRAAQGAVAAWICKTAVVFDAAQYGHDGPLAPLRPGLMETQEAGPGCIIYTGPASRPPSMQVGSPPTTVNLWMLGIRPISGKLRLTANIRQADGGVTLGTPKELAIPGYQVMVGALWAYLGGRVPPVTAEALKGFEKVWPATDESVIIRAASLDTHGVA